ncbi:hypothetical protein OESDEN_19583 [Oesophagostomum dentatum]|uniref:Uncharacterized protein n=1 Tax=Oesophagostomum dentatum TaxID=61180 RepID=A0A0B1S5X9_OESDE|nr:hypothetical protein OESDEN_19583 [Oesophagostomum dentatum]
MMRDKRTCAEYPGNRPPQWLTQPSLSLVLLPLPQWRQQLSPLLLLRKLLVNVHLLLHPENLPQNKKKKMGDSFLMMMIAMDYPEKQWRHLHHMLSQMWSANGRDPMWSHATEAQICFHRLLHNGHHSQR